MDGLTGDRGLGPLIESRPDLVRDVFVDGADVLDNPDVDTLADLVAILEAAWADRVRENREQVDRVREVPDPTDFYAPTSALFRADPARTDEPALDQLRALAAPDDVWLDIGAGAGRYALSIARLVREVIAVDPSDAMLDALREQQAAYDVPNVRTVSGRWPPAAGGALVEALGPFPCADVALIAHVSYDIEAIGPFVAAMEASARRLCVAVLMERQPSSIADVCWPPVHGETRIALPALPQFVELLRAMGREVSVTMVEREPRRFESRAMLEGFLRRQLWIAEDGALDRRFRAALDEIVVEEDGRIGLAGQRPLPTGVAVWTPGTP